MRTKKHLPSRCCPISLAHFHTHGHAVHREGAYMRLLKIAPDHDSSDGKK